MSLGQRSSSQSALTVCAWASVKPIRVRLLTLFSRLHQTWCDTWIQFSMCSYGPSRRYLTPGSRRGHQAIKLCYEHISFLVILITQDVIKIDFIRN